MEKNGDTPLRDLLTGMSFFDALRLLRMTGWVGFVSAVLVNSPDTGYGIFIENMLDAAS